MALGFHFAALGKRRSPPSLLGDVMIMVQRLVYTLSSVRKKMAGTMSIRCNPYWDVKLTNLRVERGWQFLSRGSRASRPFPQWL